MRKSGTTFLIVVFFILPFICGCDFVYRLLQREGAEEKQLLGEVIPFEFNSRVEEVQQLLKIYGYNAGTPDGKFGAKTRKAIESFQTDQGLKVSRFVDKATWAKLSLLKTSGLIGEDEEISVQVLQTALQNAGFNLGKIDGKFGNKTLQALKDFQAANGLKPDGVIGYRTISQLLKYLPAQ